jgi:hypothetical protein
MTFLPRGLCLTALTIALVLGAPPSRCAGAGAPVADSARASLLREGHVTILRYDPAKVATPGGETRFQLSCNYSYRFAYRWEDRDGRRWLSVTPHIRAKISLGHTVELPRAASDTAAWIRRLTDHELDHVAISLDRRPRLLLEQLLSEPGTLRLALPAGTPISDTLARRAVEEEVGRRKDAVSALIHASYLRLDSLTDHGRRPLEDRPAFFAGLYTRASLEALHFPFLAGVAPLLDRPEYRDAHPVALP